MPYLGPWCHIPILKRKWRKGEGKNPTRLFWLLIEPTMFFAHNKFGTRTLLIIHTPICVGIVILGSISLQCQIYHHGISSHSLILISSISVAILSRLSLFLLSFLTFIRFKFLTLCKNYLNIYSFIFIYFEFLWFPFF